MEGTFTNFEGRVQRSRQALQPPGIARPAWLVLSRLLASLEAGDAVMDARAAFGVMAARVPALGDLEWDGLGLKGAPAKTAVPAAAEA
jgi:predicted molibdopterin-dependent oxidoreductase YjgC